MKNSHIKNIFLHIGMSKTATSSIQDTLYENRDWLERNNYFYSNKLPKNHSDTFRMLCWDHPEVQHTSIKLGLNAEKIKLINKQNTHTINQEISKTNCSNIIFSGESISAFEPNELNRCKSFLNDLIPSANIYIIISTRNPIDYISSLVQQRKRTSSRGRNKNFSFLYESIFEKLFKTFGKESIIAYSFEKACQHERGPVGHFLNLIGIENELISDISIINSNSSITDKAIDIIDFINQKIPMLEDSQISDGRIHLDYAHFFKLSGEKFQIGKDSSDINISIGNLSNSCQWLRDNVGIDYKVKDLPDSAPHMVYDDTFSEEVKAIYPFLTPVLKKLTYDYINNRLQTSNTESLSNSTFSQLTKWIQSNYKSTTEHNLSSTIKLQSESISQDDKQRVQLIEILRQEEAQTGTVFISIALFLEHYGLHHEALFFKNKAKLYHSQLKSSNLKLTTNDPSATRDKNNLYQLKKRFDRNDIRPGNFFRDLSSFLERYDMLKAALYFMSKAKMYSPNLKSIDEKLKQYDKKLKIKQLPPLIGRTNAMKKIVKNIKEVLFNKYLQKLIPEGAAYKKSLENEKLLNKILNSDKAIENILNGNKTLDKILNGDRALQKILNNQEIRRKILSNKKASKESSSHNDLKKNKAQNIIKKLDYSLPSYLIGFPRSGTNFLQSVLEGSSGLLCRSLYGVPKANQDEILSLKSHTTSYDLLLDEIDRFVPNFGTPDKFILIVRDPRDVFISFYEFIQSTKGLSISQSTFIYDICYFFATFEDRHKVNSRKLEIAPLSIFDAYKKHIYSWVINRPPTMQCLTVKYEELVLSPEIEFQRLFDFLNLDCNLEKEKLKLKVSQYSQTSRKRGITTGWKDCKDEYEELISSVNKAFKEEIKILGYAEK